MLPDSRANRVVIALLLRASGGEKIHASECREGHDIFCCSQFVSPESKHRSFLVYASTSCNSFTRLPPSEVKSVGPKAMPIFLRKAVGGSPPAKIQTKSLGIF